MYSMCVFSVQDISCNEIQVLPTQMGKLLALRELNIRRNYLQVLPDGTETYTRQICQQKHKTTKSSFTVYTSYVNTMSYDKLILIISFFLSHRVVGSAID